MRTKIRFSRQRVTQVAVAEAWREARQAPDLPEPKVPDSHKFDWTFTTNYKGTLLSDKEGRKLKVLACLISTCKAHC